ncbi:MAG: mechanosensitive ion channel domain-containing protein [Candidatus Saccharimonadales bacterium]
MIEEHTFNTAVREIQEFATQPNAYRATLLLIVLIIVAFWLSRFLAKGIIKAAQFVSVRSDTETRDERVVLYRQVETYLSITVAVVRAIVVAVVAYLSWRILTPVGSASIGGSGAAAIGASAFFIVFAGQTLGMILRDITAGAAMIAERWFTIGDYIKIEPFINVTGVVERMTLRSTKIRSLSGEIIWVHNQQIQAVQVTPRALRTIAVDIFVHDRVTAEKAVNKIIDAMPTGPTMLARPLRIKYTEKWGTDLWRISIIGQTAPGREWLVEQYFVNALKEIDAGKSKSKKLLVYEPIARFADAEADRRFKQAVRPKK